MAARSLRGQPRPAHSAARLALAVVLSVSPCGCLYERNPLPLSTASFVPASPPAEFPTRPGLLVQSSGGPLAYNSARARDWDKALPHTEVRGEACQTGIQVPLLMYFLQGQSLGIWWGNGGYAEAMADAREKAPRGRLYDVRADARSVALLGGLYARQCVVVTASVTP